MSFLKNQIPQDLQEQVKSDAIGLYVGAGLSKGAGLPDWTGLLKILIKEYKQQPNYSRSKLNDYDKLVKSEDVKKLLLLAEDLKSSLGKKYYEVIYEQFVKHGKNPTKTQEQLFKLNISFIITTNYDDLLERACYNVKKDLPTPLFFNSSRDIAYNLWRKHFFILKAHGDPKVNSEHVIFTEKDYREIIYGQRGFQSALQALFSTKTILFLGTSFKDPDLILLLNFLYHSFHGGGPTHYILLPNKSVLDTESDRFMSDFNLHVIKYDPKNNHGEILEFLKTLARITK